MIGAFAYLCENHAELSWFDVRQAEYDFNVETTSQCMDPAEAEGEPLSFATCAKPFIDPTREGSTGQPEWLRAADECLATA